MAYYPIRAHDLGPSLLAEKDESSICSSNLQGYCRHGAHCDQDHSIYRVRDASRRKPRVIPAQVNYLSQAPYFTPPIDCFEDDGPGDLSVGGFRHDNDYVHIRNIQILPTIDEILSLCSGRRPYMPKKSSSDPHFLEAGAPRLLDTLFRQLRFDSTLSLMDNCYTAAQILAADDDDNVRQSTDYEARQDTLNGNRFFYFRDVHFEEIFMHERKGHIVRVSYACPARLRGRRIFNSGHFEEGMMCALVGIENDGIGLSTTFLEVHLSQSTEAMKARGGQGIRASIQLSFADADDQDSIRRMMYYGQSVLVGKFALLEFPKTLYAGFSSTLKTLRQMQGCELAFTSYIAPRGNPTTVQTATFPSTDENLLARAAHQFEVLPPVSQLEGHPTAEAEFRVLPPAYTAADKFAFDFNFLLPQNMPGGPQPLPRFPFANLHHPSVLEALQHTSLDNAQAEAFLHCLTHEMAFTQGPPGTGKSFLGINLVKAILAARGSGTKPILAVCMTNHALDSFLGGLIESGLTNIARIGGGSKEEWMQKYTLRSVSRSYRDSRYETAQKLLWKKRAQALFIEITNWCDGMNTQDNTIGWFCAKDYLEKHHPDVFHQLSTGVRTETDMACVRADGFAFEYWSRGGDLSNLHQLHKELESFMASSQDEAADGTGLSNPQTVSNILQEIYDHARRGIGSQTTGNIWALPLKTRKELITEWRNDINLQLVCDQLAELHRRHRVAREQYRTILRDVNVKCLANKNVIGCTTTGAARYWDLFKSLDIEVVICEEAGEVMEAHTLCTLFPTVEHAIFIGDPLQLRPQIAEYCLSLESKPGSKYRLDESLFERLMYPREGPAIPTAHLRTQRRMHPDIADLARATLYPYLEDHDDTSTHPPPIGLADRIYWYDHRHPEDPESTTKSHSNSYEIAMVAGLVQHLVNRSAYSLGEIAILTPYSGQLAKLMESLQTTCSVWLNDKDRQTLIDDGLLPESDEEGTVRSKEEVNMADMLRIATIDNFQGEEAKIVILSTVRSDGSPGFLRITNRINVACTRARDGFYIFGNSETLSIVPMWRNIINVFTQQNKISPVLRLTSCSRHLDHFYDIGGPADFSEVRDCDKPCGLELECGHRCLEKCHALIVHTQIGKACAEPCQKILECGHRCQKVCHELCGACIAPIGEEALSCGHTVSLTCSGGRPICNVVLEDIKLPCGHTLKLRCSQSGSARVCKEACGAQLACGHLCSGSCSDCQTSTCHQPCGSICDKPLPCGHNCDAVCHPTKAHCPRCDQPCTQKCKHGRCKNRCGQPCDPCLKMHAPACAHQAPSLMICSLPSDILPCREPCINLLACGHLCPGLCGEPCIALDMCPECKDGVFQKETQIYLPSCGHLVPVKVLDTHVGLHRYYNISLNGSILESIEIRQLPNKRFSCPCGTAIQDLRRYAIGTQLLDMQSNLDRTFAKFGRIRTRFGKKVSDLSKSLDEGFLAFCKELRPNVLAGPENTKLIKQRQEAFTELFRDVMGTKSRLIVPFEKSLEQLNTMLGGPRIAKYCVSFSLRLDLLAFRIQFGRLHEWQRVAAFIATIDDTSGTTQQYGQLLLETSIDECSLVIRKCDEVVQQCASKVLPCLEVEVRLYQLLFHGLMARCLPSSQVYEKPGIAPDRLSSSEIQQSMERMKSLCTQWLDTAGQFAEKVQSVKDFVEKPEGEIPKLYTAKLRGIEQTWGRYRLGALKACRKGHPYSGASFQGCPECGREVVEEDNTKYEERLASAETFLAWRDQRSV